MDAVNDFQREVERAGLIPSEVVPDGRLRRCGTSDKPKSKNGAYQLFEDGCGGWYQNHGNGKGPQLWQANGADMDREARRRIQKDIENQKAVREQEEAERHAKAAEEARRIVEDLPPATAENPYLKAKGVKPCNALRADGETLVVPVLGEDGKAISLQRIEPDGEKKFMTGGRTKGGYFPVKGNDGPLYLAEGLATALSIHQAMGGTVLVAFNAGNLEAVASMARERYPEREIILCADDDKGTEGKTGKNPGREAAQASARAVGGKVGFPSFQNPEVKTDFNDMHQEQGIEAVKEALEQAEDPPDFEAEEWPDPVPLPDGLPPVEPFDLALLPEVLKPWAADISERMQCPPDYVAVAIMAALGAVIGRKIAIRPQASTDWTVTPNQWALLIGRPGVLKSPAMEAALAPMKRLVAVALEQYQAERQEYATMKAVDKLRLEAAEKAARAALKDDPKADVSGLLSIETTEEPVLRRYMANDTTAAALGELHRQNPNGLLVFRDELVSLLRMLDQEENSEARGFYLTGWNGDSPYTFDRITRGMNLSIPAVCLSLLGSTQPARIAQYVKGAVTGTGDDGLLQRFGLLVWPDTSGTWKEVDRWPDTDAKNQAFKVFERLDKIDPFTIGAKQDTGIDGEPEGVPFLRFDTTGLGLFREWHQDLESRLRTGDLHPALESHFAKYRKLVPGLALILHLADGGTGPVGSHAVLQALAWNDFLATHARRLYASVTAPEVATAKAIFQKIRNGDLPAVLTVRQIWRPQWSGLTDLNEIKDGLVLLVEFNWLASRRKDTGGRPTEEFELNPKVRWSK